MAGLVLTAQQSTNFRGALVHFENKEYEKCLRALDGILAEVPTHSESLCLKGLVYHYLDKAGTEELIKEGIKSENVTSISWHICGIYYKIKRQFTEAYKAYLRSYVLEKENLMVQQDLSQLAMQERELAVVCDVRRRFLAQRPLQHHAWLGLAVAQYMNKEFSAAENTLKLYNKLLYAPTNTKEEKKRRPIDISEVLLFKNKVIYASGDIKRALINLENDEKEITDRLAVMELKAEYLQVLGRTDDALLAYNRLIDRNPNCGAYYQQVEKLLQLTEEHTRLKFYQLYQSDYPSAEYPKLQPMSFLTGDRLLHYLQEFIAQKVHKGVPSLFSLLKNLYSSHPETLAEAITSIERPQQSAQAVFWLQLQAQHCSMVGKHDEALRLISEAIDLNPEIIEIILTKCRILCAQGDFLSAKETACSALTLDEGDKYLNTEAALFALDSGDIDKCIEIASIIPLAGKNTVDGMKYLCDLEAVNFLIKFASGCAAQAEHGMALKYGHVVIDTIGQYYKDQYEFHYYGARRSTLRAYLELIKWEDSLFTHPCYLEAVELVISQYLILGQALPDGVDAVTREKMRQHRENEAKKLHAREVPPPRDGVPVIEADKDPFGVTFETAEGPLDAAFKVYTAALQELPGSFRVVQLGFKILLAQKKYILAVQLIKKAASLGASSSWVAAAASMARAALENDSAAPPVIKQLQFKVLPTIATEGDVLNEDISTYIDNYVTEDLMLWLETRIACQKTDGIDVKLLMELDTLQVSEALQIWRTLNCYGLADRFAESLRKKWPLASFL